MKVVRETDPSMKSPTMWYKYPGPHKLFKDNFDYCVVDMLDDKSVTAHTEAGWYTDPDEAKKHYDPESANAKALSDEKIAADYKAEVDEKLSAARSFTIHRRIICAGRNTRCRSMRCSGAG